MLGEIDESKVMQARSGQVQCLFEVREGREAGELGSPLVVL